MRIELLEWDGSVVEFTILELLIGISHKGEARLIRRSNRRDQARALEALVVGQERVVEVELAMAETQHFAALLARGSV